MNAISGVRVEATDDIDVLVDALIDDPSKADDIKAALRRRISAPEVVDFRSSVSAARSEQIDDDEGDLWDNVPV